MTATQTGFPVGLLRGWLPWTLLVAGAAAVWTFWPRTEPEVGHSVALPHATEVRTVERVVEQVKYIKVYPPETKAKLKLPAEVIQKPEQKVIATGKLDAEDRPYTLSTVLDTGTGEAEIFARPDPPPWIGRGRQGAVGIAYGMGNEGPTARIYARHDLLRIKALHAGVRAEASSLGEYWAGATVEWRF